MVSRSPGTAMTQSCGQAQAWVRGNYEEHPDGVVAKSVIYKHYEDHCREKGRPVMETSIFGRVVKQVFPEVNIRRLGGRDNLKYYYCGIQAQLSSPFASDNENTTRPKRKQRKRDIVADKHEARQCLRWLHTYYTADRDSSVPKCEMYAHYTQSSLTWTREPLSQQQFTIVVMNGFNRISKRKVGPKSPQQNVFVGITLRPNPCDPNSIPEEVLNFFEVLSNNSKLGTFREGSHTPDDEDDYSCRSPDSEEGSDMSAGNSENSCSELKSECLSEMYSYHPMDDSVIKNEPVDYRIATLRLKDEPIDSSMSVMVKQENFCDSGHNCYQSEVSPERPPSHMIESPSPSPSPPPKSSKNRIYKPRFHINYHDTNWTSEAEIKQEQDQCLMEDMQPHWDNVLRQWLVECLEKFGGVYVNRDQVYILYKKYCHQTNGDVVSVSHFDKIVMKTYPTVNMMHSSDGVYYEGVRVIHNSDIDGQVEERFFNDLGDEGQPWDNHTQASLEMNSSPAGHSSSLINLDYDEEEDDALDDGFSVDKYRETPDDDLHSIPEVLRDGKYYLKNWLMDNFEMVPEACVLKADAYRHYEIYAKSVMQTPFEMNVFGKIVRQVFPKVTIRRLGGRLKPQYHYCGITAKPTSALYPHVGGKDPAQRSRKKEIATDNRTAELVIDWLKKTYQSGKDTLITKSDVFQNYSAYCGAIDETPVSLNYFGKLVKYCFPNVEVRKFGGRSEPNWYYHGVCPKDPTMLQQTISIEELSEATSLGQYTNSTQSSHHMPSSNQLQHQPLYHHHHHHHHHPMNSSNPIAVPGGGSGSAHDSPYSGSPQVLNPSLSQRFMQSHHVVSQHSPSPFGSSSLETRSALTPEPYPRSPGLSRAFRDGLMTHNNLDSSRMMLRSPYDSADVAPESIFPRSPEDTSAQTCRSPAASHSDPALHMSSQAYMSQGGVLMSSSPNSKRGAQVVPSQTPPSYMASSSLVHPGVDVGAVYKRAKHQVGPQDYTFSGRS